MTEPERSNGLVRTLLFPSYADAGSNDAFQPEPDESVVSEASTAIHDNRSRTQQQQQQQQPPPFFASTRPSASQAAAAVPATPPAFSRGEAFAASRSLSTIAMARGEVIMSSSSSVASGDGDNMIPTAALLLNNDKLSVAESASSDPTTENKKSVDAVASDEPPNESSREDDLQTLQPADSTTTEPETSEHVDDSSASGVKPEDVSNGSEADVKDENRDDDEEGGKQGDKPVLAWEEEATPEQTAFGKQLLFRRQELKDNNSDEASSQVLSTASEMGTVVGVSTEDRLAELDAMVEGATFSNVNVENNTSIPNSSTDAQMSSPPPALPSHKDWAAKDLAIPLLHRERDDDHSSDEYTPRLLSLENDEKKFAEVGEDRPRIRPRQRQATTHTADAATRTAESRPRTSALLSKAFRRIGSGLTGSGNSFSAPSTPAAPSTPHPEPPLVPQSPLLSQERRPLLSPRRNAEELTPSSFLLRSPGSAAFEAASSSARSILSPRFRRNEFRRDVARIDEDKVATTQALVQPSLGQPTSTALQLAKSCFSFDAYDTTDDAVFEMPLESNKDVRWLHEPLNSQEIRRTSKSWDSGSFALRPAPFRGKIPGAKFDPYAFQSPERRPREWTSDPDVLVELQTPQRLEIEREDALDILACLVERGITFKQGDQAETEKDSSDNQNSSSVSQTVEELKALIAADDKESQPHRQQLAALEELTRSHEYALEMRRASQSAMSWLKSIGRTAREETVPVLKDGEQTAGEDASEGIDLLTAKARMHAAQMELQEKTEYADRLNEELAQCRAEIGRLRSEAQGASFRSPNRSILDESDEVSGVEEEAVEVVEQSFESSSSIVGMDDSGFLGSSFLNKQTTRALDEPVYRSALERANEQIRKLHRDLREKVGEDGDIEANAPIVSVPDERSPISESPSNKEQRTVNVNMLDAENFVTDWSDLAPLLPPPPDHGLRSPIVAAVLEQWSNSPDLHESLLNWTDQVLAGQPPESIPPLTLSNLDHQVRDGFVMHVLPLLLRRADIRVDVKTRVHRLTTYDLAVEVEPAQRAHVPLDVRRHLETISARSDVGTASTTHSATTTLTANHSVAAARIMVNTQTDHTELEPAGSSRISYDEMAEHGLGVDPHPGLMSALGGALGGLLTRRKPSPGGGSTPLSAALDSSPYEKAQAAANTTATAVEALSEAGRVFLDEGAASGEEQPYHRVVSAPPGRIGVTFVEYRGHAMVSDVGPTSPLAGWVFPSDILIAIDELPVSGMRVRDIIKVLKDRMGRQRALRVISSHAMNEFTLNSSAIMVDGN